MMTLNQVCEGVQIAPIRYDLAEGATGFTKTWDDFSIDADIIFTQVGQLLTITGTPTFDVVTIQLPPLVFQIVLVIVKQKL